MAHVRPNNGASTGTNTGAGGVGATIDIRARSSPARGAREEAPPEIGKLDKAIVVGVLLVVEATVM